ncbi:MAG: inositol monophosphatase family protein [Thermonemataceae bacterium]
MNLEQLCQQVRQLTREVGLFIAQQAQDFDKAKVEHKGFNDLVSYVDKEAEKRLLVRLAQLLPEAGFISEEDKNNHQLADKPYHWIVDPLDGTTNFVHQLPIFSISIALLQEQTLVLGVVYEINRKECFYAWKNGGAYCNGLKIQVSPASQLSDSLLATGFPYYDFDKMPQYLAILEKFMQQTQGLRRLGSAAVDLAYVACGRFEGFFEYNLQPWDVAAGALLVKEAGGEVSTFSQTQGFLFGKEIVAAGNIHQPMLEVIQQHWV